MPQIGVVINNYEGFIDKFGDKFDDILLTLCRDGTKYGIIFVLTASTYNSIRYRLSQNFRQKVALQLNNEDDFMNILEGVKRKRPAHLFGRGLIKYNDIFEFQTARICESEKWNIFIKEKIRKLNEKYAIKAKTIPVLPTQIKLDDVKQQINQLEKVPIGIFKSNLKFCSLISSNLISPLSNLRSTSNLKPYAER